MADPLLEGLAKHYRREAAADRARLAAHRGNPREADRLTRRIALWLQLADEVDAYLAGELQDDTEASPSDPLFALPEATP